MLCRSIRALHLNRSAVTGNALGLRSTGDRPGAAYIERNEPEAVIQFFFQGGGYDGCCSGVSADDLHMHVHCHPAWSRVAESGNRVLGACHAVRQYLHHGADGVAAHHHLLFVSGVHEVLVLALDEDAGVIRKPKHISERLPEILDGLEEMAHGFDPANGSAALLADAYQWYYESGKHTFDAYGKGNHDNVLESLDVLDSLLDDDPDAIFDANEALQVRNAPPKGQLAGFRLNDSNITISPNFGKSFQLIPETSRRLVVEKLKEFAKVTADGQGDRQKQVRSMASSQFGMITLQAGPGILLCIELEDVMHTAFLGFLVPGTYRPLDANSNAGLSASSGMNTIAKIAFALSFLLLISTMIYVPYDAVMKGNGAAMQVFNSYDFVWANPNLNKVCSWYLDVTLDGFTRAARGCYAIVAIARLVMTTGAAALLSLGCFLWMKGTTKNKV